jgi:hypothetical protein
MTASRTGKIMLKEILIGIAAGVSLVSTTAFAQSSNDDWEAAAKTIGRAYGQAYNDADVARTEPIGADTAPAPPANEPLEAQLPEAALERLAGRYTAQDTSQIVVTRAGNRLTANLAGLSLEFLPSGPYEFFIQGSPLTLSFAQGEAGKAQFLIVRENGTVIMQASASR